MDDFGKVEIKYAPANMSQYIREHTEKREENRIKKKKNHESGLWRCKYEDKIMRRGDYTLLLDWERRKKSYAFFKNCFWDFWTYAL